MPPETIVCPTLLCGVGWCALQPLEGIAAACESALELPAQAVDMRPPPMASRADSTATALRSTTTRPRNGKVAVVPTRRSAPMSRIRLARYQHVQPR